MVLANALPSPRQQLAAFDQTHELFTRGAIDYWLFGGGQSTSTWGRSLESTMIEAAKDRADFATLSQLG